MADNRQQDTKVQLKRELGLLEAVSLVIGSIIGAGIFVSPKGVIRATGSVGLCLVVWVIAGLACLGDALCFAELGTLIPKSGGMYTYLQLGLGNFVSFLFALQATFLLRPGSLVIFMLTFAKYLVTLLPICGSPQKLEKIIAAAGLVTLYLVNCCGTRYGAQVAKVTTLCKLLALGVIIVAGLVAISHGVTSELGTGFQDTSTEVSSLALALYSAMFATRGGAEVNNVIEEIKKPSKNVPRALILGVITVVIVYLLTNIAYLAVMTRAEMIAAPAVGVLFAERTLGVAALIVPLAVVVSTLGIGNNNVINTSRMTFTAARDGNLPDFLSYIQVDRLVPLNSMTSLVIMALLFMIYGDVGTLINYSSFLNSLYNAGVYLALIIFRFKTFKNVKRVIKVPLLIPVLMFLLNIYLFIAPLAINPQIEFVYFGGGALALSTIIYLMFVHFKLSPPFYDQCVTQLQLILRLAPPKRFENIQ